MRILAFIDDASAVRKILDHTGESAENRPGARATAVEGCKSFGASVQRS